MAAAPQTPHAPAQLDRRALYFVRGVTFTLLVVILVTLILVAFPSLCATSTFWVVAPLLALTFPYLLILYELRDKTVKQGLALAVGWSTVFAGGLPILTWLVGQDLREAGWTPGQHPARFAILLALHLAMLGAAVRTYYSLARETNDRRQLTSGVGKGLVFLFLVMVVAVGLPISHPSRMAINESLAVGLLRSITTAAVSYSHDYNTGYPASISLLGPAPTGQSGCWAAGFVDDLTAGGRKSGYSFEYIPGPPTPNTAAGCPAGVWSYQVIARPATFGGTGCRSFITDQSGIIHWTRENRAATRDDPIIPVQGPE